MDELDAQQRHGGALRRLRHATRALNRWLGADELQRWVLGLPFVDKLDALPAAPLVWRFAIRCPPLGVSSVLLLTGGFASHEPARSSLTSDRMYAAGTLINALRVAVVPQRGPAASRVARKRPARFAVSCDAFSAPADNRRRRTRTLSND